MPYFTALFIWTLNRPTAQITYRPIYRLSRYEIASLCLWEWTALSLYRFGCFVLRLSAISRGPGHGRDRLSTSGFSTVRVDRQIKAHAYSIERRTATDGNSVRWGFTAAKSIQQQPKSRRDCTHGWSYTVRPSVNYPITAPLSVCSMHQVTYYSSPLLQVKRQGYPRSRPEG